jgi:RimJ/RimL family protein N-acetyltransferase
VSGCWPVVPAEGSRPTTPDEPGAGPGGGPVLLSPAYPIRTPRLSLRPWRGDEVDRYHRLRGDPEVARYLYDEPLTRRQAADRLAGLHTEIAEEGVWMNLAVEVVGPGPVIGDVGLNWVNHTHRQAEIGYVFDARYRGHGYATEAAAALVDLAFTGLGAHRVCGRLDARNRASARLLERLGMRREAHLVENEWVKGEWADEAIYAVLAREWPGADAATMLADPNR